MAALGALSGEDGTGGAEVNPFAAQLAQEAARSDALAQSLIGSRAATSGLRDKQSQTEAINTLLKLVQLQQLTGSPSGASFSI